MTHTSGKWQLPTGFESVHPCEHEGLPVFVDSDPFDTIAMVMPREDGNDNARLIASAPEMLNEHEKNDDIIHKHMGAIEAGEYNFGMITEILCEIQNNSRVAITKAKGA